MASLRFQPPDQWQPFRRGGNLGGSVLVVVMVTLIFATFALLAFMEKASSDLLVDRREAVARRLRMEAYSALEVTLAVLEDFRAANNGLHSPAEGWDDPLAFAGYTPAEDRAVEIAFEDESGKISLPRVNAITLTNLFKNWDIPQVDAEALADVLMGWMKKNHIYSSAVAPDYEQSPIPFEAPGRSLRSFRELAAIDKVRDLFFDSEGRPNDLWRRFADSVSLLDFQKANLNGARPDTLAAVGQFDQTQQQNLTDYLKGSGSYQTQGPGYFQNAGDAQRITGPTGDVAGFGTTISALRIMVTVHDGRSQFRLAAVIAPPNGATSVHATATSQRTQASASSAQTAAQQQNRPSATQNNPQAAAAANRTGAGAQNLRYPFALLEIRENDEISPAPAPVVASIE
ncbi:MAG: general secretion pathway protein GspK [Verrucomicrobia bacterium]|nr:general secretion pathway protein GspK [Verrucomicrobiota bacterium]